MYQIVLKKKEREQVILEADSKVRAEKWVALLKKEAKESEDCFECFIKESNELVIKPERFENILVYDLVYDDIVSCSFVLEPMNDGLIEDVNRIRIEQGYSDLVADLMENDVYYNFYLVLDIVNQRIKVEAICQHGEKDDYACYEIPLTEDEERILMNYAIRHMFFLVKEKKKQWKFLSAMFEVV